VIAEFPLKTFSESRMKARRDNQDYMGDEGIPCARKFTLRQPREFLGMRIRGRGNGEDAKKRVSREKGDERYSEGNMGTRDKKSEDMFGEIRR